jgi:hypothetical protein
MCYLNDAFLMTEDSIYCWLLRIVPTSDSRFDSLIDTLYILLSLHYS